MLKPFVRNVTTRQELLWHSIKIRKSLDDICHTLELTIPPSELVKVRKHHRLQVCCRNKLINGSNKEPLVTTVLVDEITASSDTEKHSVTIYGRSPARDIIDSQWSDLDDWRNDGDTYDNKTLLKIVKRIGEKFNIICDIFPKDQPTKIVPVFYFENESPWTKLIDEADQQGLIFTSNEAEIYISGKLLPTLEKEGSILPKEKM